MQLEQTFNEIETGFKVEIWGPDQVDETVKGQNHDEGARSAAQVAEKIGADVLIYGWVDTTDVIWQVTPEFYVSADNFYEAEEVTGQHNLGAPFSVMGQGNIATRREVSGEFTSRTRALARITVGLAYYSVRDFKTALSFLQSAGEIQEWEDDEGKEVLYLLVGNAAGRIGDLELARTYHQQALSLDPEYARAYVGLASVYYMSALKPYEETGSPMKTDLNLLSLAITTYKQAAQAAHQPPLSDIPVKVHFGLGQCYFMLVYSGNEELFAPAIVEFEAVIEAHADGANPRVLEMAAESYARLGLIYDLSGHSNWAIENYQKAASLLKDNPERQALYEGRAQAISDETRGQ
ncbi:MAG: hypothetical protein DRI81_17015 [Chloroflexi bacterium]|nr:MAG: hypothetical protein DRI81_17015 [Chloroflexota bacterium]